MNSEESGICGFDGYVGFSVRDARCLVDLLQNDIVQFFPVGKLQDSEDVSNTPACIRHKYSGHVADISSDNLRLSRRNGHDEICLHFSSIERKYRL